MKVVFISNFINHHQVPLADSLYELLDGDFYFIETISMPLSTKHIGYPEYNSRPYLIQTWRNHNAKSQSYEICEAADVILFSTAYSSEYVHRFYNSNKIWFEVGERWLKKGFFNILSPRFIRWLYEYHRYYKRNKFYRLCSSAYAKHDVNLFGAYIGRCFKWGYFTKVERRHLSFSRDNRDDVVSLMWCARFIGWKHPELPIKLAKRLKNKGYRFIIDMFGSGHIIEDMKRLAHKLNVDDIVKFRGNFPNDQIINEMRNHDIFLFTSDRNEGWGAVLNEAMANNCTVIASDQIGSVPFLIDHLSNGLIFKSCDLDDLESKVSFLINNPDKRLELSKNAYNTMIDTWSPSSASKQLLSLIDALVNDDENLIPKVGPCSKA